MSLFNKKEITVDDVRELFASKSTANLNDHHFTEPEPIKCKWCGSIEIKKYGLSGGEQEYFCLSCKRKFTNNDNPIGKRSSVEDIGTSISSYYDGLSFEDIARHLRES